MWSLSRYSGTFLMPIPPRRSEKTESGIGAGMRRILSTAAALLLVAPLALQLTTQRMASAATSFTVTATADSYVDSARPTTNFGTNTTLKTDTEPVVRAFMRFHVSGTSGSVLRATLRVYAVSGNAAGYRVRQGGSTTWNEKAITHRNAPKPGPLVGTSGAVTMASWSTVDVTPAVTGDGPITLILSGQNGLETRYRSREGGPPPVLVVEVSDPAPSPSPSPGESTFPPPVGSPGSAGWIVSCGYSHSLPDDPIVAPGQSGASHLHDFFANVTTKASSTYGSMTAGGTTCPKTSGDTAGYWVPALYQNGVQVLAQGPPPTGTKAGTSGARQQFYYRNNLNGYPPSAIETIPADLRIIAGNGKAQSAEDNYYLGRELYWGCSDNSTGKLKAPPASCSTGIISLHVGFPNCWDGIRVDSSDHRSHMSYPVENAQDEYVCPGTHPVPIPRVIMRLEYPVGTVTGYISLSSGAPYSIHGDFWNTWVQSRLNELVDACIDRGLDCGKV
jgi:hypothetical protein